MTTDADSSQYAKIRRFKPYMGIMAIFFVVYGITDFLFHFSGLVGSAETWGESIGIAGTASWISLLVYLELFQSW